MVADAPAQDIAEAKAWAMSAQQGDAVAFARIVQAYVDRLARYISMMGIAGADADDLVQETFIRAHAALDRYNPKYAVSTWLYTIGRRLALNFIRDRKSHVSLEIVAGQTQDNDEGPDHSGLWTQARTVLSDRYYEALWLSYGEDLSMTEIAEVMEVSVSNAKVLVHRARQKLAETLDPAEWMEGCAS